MAASVPVVRNAAAVARSMQTAVQEPLNNVG